jgi:hypothetical protein
MTEPERSAEESRLRSNAALGQAIGAPFSVEEELHRHGLKSGAELAEEQKAAEAAKTVEAERKAKAQADATDRASTRAEIDVLARQLRELESGGR